MHILINAFSARRGGGQTYLVNLLRYIPASHDDVRITLLVPDTLSVPNDERINRFITRFPVNNPLLRTIWEKLLLPYWLIKLEVDVYFCPGGVISHWVPARCKSVTMFRNMIPFDIQHRKMYPYGYMRIRNWLLQRIMLSSMLSADKVIFISEHGKTTIEKYCRCHLKNSIVIPHGINDYFRKPVESLNRPGWLPAEEYFLYVSILDVYKSQLEVVQGFHNYVSKYNTGRKLILIGAYDFEYGKQVQELIQDLSLQSDVILTGEVPYTDLPGAYLHAKINIFASRCENCPNILLEAMAAGRPLLVSSFPPMPEFAADAALYFNPESAEDFADKLHQIEDDLELQDKLSKAAERRSLDFQWQLTAEKTWNYLLN